MDRDPSGASNTRVATRSDQPRIQRVRRLVPVVVYALGVLVASVATPPSGALAPLGPFGIIGVDKWLHLGAYAGLSAGIGYAIHAAELQRLAVAALVAIAFGAGVEVVQTVLPARALTGADVLANTIGALAGSACRWLWLRIEDRAV